MNMRISTRLTLWFFLIFGSMLVALSVARHLVFMWGEQENLDEQGKAYATLLLAEPAIRNAPVPQLVSMLDSLACESDLQYRSLRFFLHNGDSVLFDNAARGRVLPVIDSLRAGIGRKEGFASLDSFSRPYRTYTVSPEGAYAGRLFLSVIIPRDELDASLGRLRLFLVIGLLLALAIAWFGGLLLTRRSLALVEEMRRTAAEITGTNLAQRVPVGKTQDELTALALTFNKMIERLQRYSDSYRVFVTNTSHDLRTPLTIIRAELQLGMAGENLTPEISEMIRSCVSQLDRLDRLTADLLFLAKLEADGIQLRPHNIGLEELVLECAETMQRLAQKKKMSLDITLPEDRTVDCVCDDHLVRRAVTNLLENAINYSPEESTIHISLQATENEARIIVADDGPGMGEEEMRRATERLYRGPASHGSSGSGLGLAIAKEIAEAHGGRLIIDSIPGDGTAVLLVIPLSLQL